ncbi:AMP-binding protein [Spongiivirga citrea]|uniref:AMP-binding protein n=1 Tax=Spongiivirga citrea TaxID=1481457 RepID=A0A6M0CIS8_9FLAO|nr:AMP-binding protein [Spongiivirga citrea]NER16883.1 AMP-binding protein [Spongiivirga citrea]
MKFLNSLYNSFITNAARNAFCIQDTMYSYEELNNAIESIRNIIQQKIGFEHQYVGLVLRDDLTTYASIFALWFEGKAYVPINPAAPISRNLETLNKIGARAIFDTQTNGADFEGIELVCTNDEYSNTVVSGSFSTTFENIDSINHAYVLFTSGSTGKPKGIPISFGNVDALINGLGTDDNFSIQDNDRCLQMYDLTFDASLTAILPAMLAGACLYTVDPGSIKYFQILKLLNRYELTVLKMVPSIIHYLRPYFDQILAKQVRYCIFGGGKLFDDILSEWRKCIPNSIIVNHYGPTESTVCSHRYYISKNQPKTYNGIVSIGKPWPKLDCIIVDESNNMLENGKEGELCISGPQLTGGYWMNDMLNTSVFFDCKHESGELKRYYKTGDLCYRDNEGDFLFVGRKDFQVKVRGYRVELAEIEFHIKQITNLVDVIAIDVENSLGNTEIGVGFVGQPFEMGDLLSKMRTKVPSYMVPTRHAFFNDFPMNSNGKIDRKQLRLKFK